MEPMRPPNVTRCKSCGAEIFFAQSKGKYIPLDVEPVPCLDANEDLPKTETLFTMGGISFPAVTGDAIPDYCDTWFYGYRSHFATCPNAKQHKKPRPEIQAEGQEKLF